MSRLHLPLAAALLALGAGAASAHVSLENKEAAVGSTQKLVFRVPHGCAGQATTKIRVQIPDGVEEAKPMPKGGWQLDLVTAEPSGNAPEAADDHGKAGHHDEHESPAVKEIAWSGSLPDAFYDEFVVRVELSRSLKPNAMLYFPVVQECGATAERWIDIPVAGKSADDAESPAPGIRIVPRK